MTAIYGSYVAFTVLYTFVGLHMRITTDDRRWWGTLLTSVYVCLFANAPLQYDAEYLFGTVQPYEPMSQVVGCIVTYLACDLLYRPKEWDVMIHHVESLMGLTLALLGYNVGVLNNCVLNEYSTIWLVLLHYAKTHSTIPLVRKWLLPSSWALFVVTFVTYRIIPCSAMLWAIASYWAQVVHDAPSLIHVLCFLSHCGLQFYWLAKIVQSTVVRVRPDAWTRLGAMGRVAR